MTGEPWSDRVALSALVGVGLLVAGLTWPDGPASGGPPDAIDATDASDADEAASPENQLPAPTLQVEPPQVLLQADGLVLEQQSWRLGEAHGKAWRVHVPLPGRVQVRPSPTGGVVPFSDLLPTDAGPWAALNGGFYERGPMGLVVSDGIEVSPLSSRGGSGVFSWGPAGPAVVHRTAWHAGAPQALQSIDRLVDAGKSLVKRKEAARSAARSAVAISDGQLWLVALADDDSIDPLPGGAGPGEGGVQLHDTVVIGLPLWIFADYLVDQLGARSALNLDGAISTQLLVRTPGHSFEVRGENGTIDSVVIRPPAAMSIQ